VSDWVSALAVYDDGSGPGPQLYAGGNFHGAGGLVAHGIARWNGSIWRAIGGNHKVLALAVFDDQSGGGPALFAGGTFTSMGGVPANRIAKWDGMNWSALGSGLSGNSNPQVLALGVFDDGSGGGPALFAGGSFFGAGGAAATRIARWDGSNWSAIGGGVNREVNALAVFDDGGGPALLAGGEFRVIGGVQVMYVGRWDGVGWSGLGNGLTNSVLALEVFDDGSGGGPALFAAGFPLRPGGALAAASSVLKWNGPGWTALGSTTGNVRALQVFDDGGGAALYAGGSISSLGGSLAAGIAEWDGSTWSALGSGISGSVGALEVYDDGSGPGLFVGGWFTTAGGKAATGIAQWDGASWSALGSGMSGGIGFPGVEALAVFDDGSGGGPALYAGGAFTGAGGAAASHIARWDGASWSAVGSGVDGTNDDVQALAVFDDGSGGGPALYVGGDFTTAGGIVANGIAKWDGSSWSSLGSGLTFGSFGVSALKVFDDGSGGGPALYAGGFFTSAGGIAVNRIAKWDGSSWSALSSGMNNSVRAFTAFDDGSTMGPALIAGGSFTASASGDSKIAKWGCPLSTPLTSFCTAKTTLACGAAHLDATGVSSAAAASGFVIRAQPVLGCRAGLLLYTNQPVQAGASFGGPGNGLLCMSGMGLRRAGPIESGGTPTPACDGVMSIDMNQFRALNWTASGCNPAAGQTTPAGFLGNMGVTVNAQLWGRDSVTTGQVLTDGISWNVGP
jgi:hypothetical protein